MQMSLSLADFMSQLDDGPRGAEDAMTAIAECARNSDSVLDLQQMSLTDEDLKTILPRFEQVASHVTTLNLFMNDLTVLPEAISTLSKLKVLHVGCNPLETIETGALDSLDSLEELDIGFSETLTTLPDSFAKLQSLRILLAGNGRLEKLPPSLFQCTALEEIHIYGNCLKEITSSIGSLSNLKVLSAGRNQITSISEDVGKCTKLTTLLFYENCLSRLPKGIASIESLEILNVDSNDDMPMLPRDIRCSADLKATATFYATSTTK